MPLRRCVGCGRIAPKSELLRIALAGPRDGAGPRRAVLDRDGKLPGRGAYLCRIERPGSVPVVACACLRAATRRRAIPRALRSPLTLDPELVESPAGARGRTGGQSAPSILSIES